MTKKMTLIVLCFVVVCVQQTVISQDTANDIGEPEFEEPPFNVISDEAITQLQDVMANLPVRKGLGTTLSTLVMDYIFQNAKGKYDPKVAPASPTNVYFTMAALSINGVDESGIIDMSLSMAVTWQDNRLMWTAVSDEVESQGVNITVPDRLYIFPTNLIWFPHYQVQNSVFKQVDKSYWEDFPSTVSETGAVVWRHSQTVHLSCDFNLVMYPYDIQECKLELIGNYENNDISFYFENSDIPICFNEFVENANWQIIAVRARKRVVSERFDQLRFYFLMRRKPLAGLLYVVVPIVLVMLAGVCQFILPATSGEKMSFAVTLLIGYFVLFLALQVTIPSASDNIPYLTFFLLSVMTLALVETICSGIVLAVGDTNNLKSKRQAADRQMWSYRLNTFFLFFFIGVTIATGAIFIKLLSQPYTPKNEYAPPNYNRACPWPEGNFSIFQPGFTTAPPDAEYFDNGED